MATTGQTGTDKKTDARYEELLACSRCGTCLPACPSYAATLDEARSPRGRVQLVLALHDGRLQNSPGLRDALSACLDCRACETVCPNGVHPGQISVHTRAELMKTPPLARAARRAVLGPVLRNPALQEVGAAVLRHTYQKTGLQQGLRRSGVLKRLPMVERLDAYLPPLPARSVRQSLPELVPAVGERRGRVGLFVGCAMNTVFADVTRRTVSALSRLGFDVVLPRGVVCCGAPQVSLGEMDLARDMARRNLRFFEDVEAIVTDCAACGAELKHYTAMLDDASAASFTSRVRDFSEFVEPFLPDDLPRRGEPVTWHAPCHLAHAQGVRRTPEAVLGRLCADYRPLEEADRCCGGADVYFAQHPEIADDARTRKMENLRATGARTVVTGNPGCLLQLMARTGDADTWRIAHLSEIVDEALGGRRRVTASDLDRLRAVLPPGRVASDPESLVVYGYDGATSVTGKPDAVVSVQSEAEVVAVLAFASEHRVPVFPRGAATGLAGGSVPQGGVALNLAPMRRIHEIDEESLMAVVDADFQSAVEKRGLFYPPDPASLKQSTLGGNVATGAGGPRCLKYGTTREYVRGIRAVLPGGRVIADGGKYLKSASGYNLSQLFVGSEGTLGVVTQITLRLLPKPPATGTVFALFPRLEDATGIVTRILGAGVLPSVLEFMDRHCIACVEQAAGLGLPTDIEAAVLIECDGAPAAVADDIARVGELCASGGAREVRRATTEAERTELWLARRSVSPSLSRLRPARLGEDISLPRAAIVPMVRRVQEIADAFHLLIPTFGHIGDGNLHPNVLYDPRDPDETSRVHGAAEVLVRAAVELGGTLSGEHGIGLLKREFLPLAVPTENLALYRAIKAAFDPDHLLNPGKIFV